MANTKKKYSPFKDWLQCCRGFSPAQAKALVSYIRQQEEKGLFKHAQVDGSFEQIHKTLNDIDLGLVSDNIDDVVDSLKTLYKQLKDEAFNPDIESAYDTCKGWRRAFNLYLQFLAEVTDSFGYEQVLNVNPKVQIPTRSGDSKNRYEKRLLIFRSGAYRNFFKELTDKVWNKILDNLSDAIEAVLSQKGSLQVLPSFITLSDEVCHVFNWRDLAFDKLVDSTEMGNNEQCTLKVNINSRCSVIDLFDNKTKVMHDALVLTEIINAQIYGIEKEGKCDKHPEPLNYEYLYGQIYSLLNTIFEYFACYNLRIE